MKSISKYSAGLGLAMSLGVSLWLTADESHVVIKGDTLWDISAEYLQNPFQWPSIWKSNPQIQDPHWIYPGDRINLGATSQSKVSVVNPNSQLESTSSTITPVTLYKTDLQQSFARKLGSLLVQSNAISSNTESRTLDGVMGGSSGPEYQAITESLVKTAPFVRTPDENGDIFFGQTALKIPEEQQENLLQLFSVIGLARGNSTGVKIGDRYLVYLVEDSRLDYTRSQTLGKLVVPKGILEVSEVTEKSSQAKLVECYGIIPSNAVAAPFEAVQEIQILGYLKTNNPKPLGQIIYISDRQELVQPYTFVIIDHGKDKGFKPGDAIILVDRQKKKISNHVIARGIVVRLENESATIFVSEMFSNRLSRGDYMVLIQSATNQLSPS